MSIFCGNHIMQRRRELGLTQEELADKVGLSQKTISKIENGLEEPKITALAVIADALSCEITELIERHEEVR